jgi:hypothetical protein
MTKSRLSRLRLNMNLGLRFLNRFIHLGRRIFQDTAMTHGQPGWLQVA